VHFVADKSGVGKKAVGSINSDAPGLIIPASNSKSSLMKRVGKELT